MISIIIPVFNSEKTIEVLVDSIVKILDKNYEFEVILVNDTSVDNSEEKCKELVQKYKNTILLSLSKNVGEHNAIMAGLNKCSGDYAITMSDDLQHIIRSFVEYIIRFVDDTEESSAMENSNTNMNTNTSMTNIDTQTQSYNKFGHKRNKLDAKIWRDLTAVSESNVKHLYFNSKNQNRIRLLLDACNDNTVSERYIRTSWLFIKNICEQEVDHTTDEQLYCFVEAVRMMCAKLRKWMDTAEQVKFDTISGKLQPLFLQTNNFPAASNYTRQC
jgi:glycosyltransferase involved in cell wall biosynthesis